MPKKSHNKGALLEVIPCSLLEPEQVARWFQRMPTQLSELNQYQHAMAIWLFNGTLTYVSPRGNTDVPSTDQDSLSLNFCNTGLDLYIVGQTTRPLPKRQHSL